MIVNFPTGLYASILPVNPEDKGNVTFTISNNNPPRTNLIFPKIPTGLVLRRREVVTKPITVRRESVGDLIFSISTAKRSVLGNNARQYELGQVLSFDEVPTVDVEPMLVNPTTELRHDTNILNNESMGLSESDVATIATASLQVQDALTNELNLLKEQRADAELTITNQQKIANETGKTLSALQVIQEQAPSDDVAALIVRLEQRQTDAIAARDVAIATANDVAAQADVILAQLRAVATVVK